MGELVEADVAIVVLVHLLEQSLHLRTEGGVLYIATEGGRNQIQNIGMSSCALHKVKLQQWEGWRRERGGGRREGGRGGGEKGGY